MLIGRRNLSKEDRDELIRRLAASGHKQKDIAEKVGLSKQAVSKIVNPSPQSGHEPSIKSTSAAEGWTQTEIGEAVGANQSTVSRVLMQTHKSQNSQTDDSTTTQRLKDELARHATGCTTDRLFLSFR